MHERPDSDAQVEDLDADDDRVAAPADDRPLGRWAQSWRLKSDVERIAVVIEAVIVAACVTFVLAQLSPRLLVANTTPAGGDMGAHVWGPAYLRDHLLPEGRLTGWAPDWYAGFPAYQFYMVVPALLIVALNAGFQGWAALFPLAAALVLFVVSLRDHRPAVRRAAFVAAIGVAVIGAGLPYGVAFKWVTVLGLLALPVCAYVAGRLADVPFPGPPMLAVGAVVFLFNREPLSNSTGNIIGGNVASTMAGEFSFSISLALAVLYFGFLLRGLRTGRHRGVAVVLLALTGLCHIIPAIYAAVATVVALAVSAPWTMKRLLWLLPIGPIAALLSAFWVLPFVGRRELLNDMGWEKVPGPGANINDFLFPGPIRWALALAIVGTAISVALRNRLGLFLAGNAVVFSVLFWQSPQWRLWNARLLPFIFLCLFLLAALAVAEIGRAIASLVSVDPDRPASGFTLGTAPVGFLLAFVIVGLPLGVLPFDRVTPEGGYSWAGIEVAPSSRNVVREWARWNFTGYERKPAYPEYHGLISMMQQVGTTHGCGRAMWEYENDRLNQYGTPMAPMLLPYWTDGCIGSMEGLYFEASATTPYHFLNQRALSASCSCAQRAMPYGAFDVGLGIEQLQLMGVRYYLAFSLQAVAAAATHPDLTEVATDGPWHAYIVADSSIVEPLEFQPVVLTGPIEGRDWLGPSTDFFQDPTQYPVMLADRGPVAWERIDVCEGPPKADGTDERFHRLDVCTTPTRQALAPITVNGLEVGRDSIRFDVSDIGVPVLVKASYFPNWQVSGADGPYRVAPNLMVVIPTETHVELSYGWTSLDVSVYVLTFAGILAAVWLARRPVRDPGRLALDAGDRTFVFIPLARPSDDDEETDVEADVLAQRVHDGVDDDDGDEWLDDEMWDRVEPDNAPDDPPERR